MESMISSGGQVPTNYTRDNIAARRPPLGLDKSQLNRLERDAKDKSKPESTS
jgi:hypothetical protein